MDLIRANGYLVVMIALLLMFTLIGINKLEQEVQYKDVIVEEGDTLWGYSIQYANNVPTEKWVSEIIRVNNLESTVIKVGETLKIPNGLGKKVTENQMAGDD